MLWLLVPLASSILHAFAATFEKKAITKNEPTTFLFFCLCTIFVLMLPFTPLFFRVTNHIAFLKFIAAIALIDSIANILYMRVFSKDEASYCIPIRSMAPFFTILFAFLLAPAELVSLKVFLALITIISSVYVLNLKDGPIDPFIALFREDNIFLLVATLFFGFSSLLYKFALEYTNPVTLYFLRIGLMIPLVFMFTRGHVRMPKNFKQLVIAQVFYIFTFVLYYLAISQYNLLVSVTLGNLAPLFLVGISAVMLRERITWQKIVASAIIVVGVFVLV